MHQPISRPIFLYRTSLLASLSLLLISSTPVISSAQAETGIASYYSARGPGLTCAHRTRPFGSMVTVRYQTRSIQCRINDRGPFIRGRIIDLSLSAARALGMMQSGIVRVSLE